MFAANHSGPLVFANARIFLGLVKLKANARPFHISMVHAKVKYK